MTKKCKKCGKELDGEYSEVMANREFVVVDEQTQKTIILYQGDCLCKNCGGVVTYYGRIKE